MHASVTASCDVIIHSIMIAITALGPAFDRHSLQLQPYVWRWCTALTYKIRLGSCTASVRFGRTLKIAGLIVMPKLFAH
jgi:hypothetical protein